MSGKNASLRYRNGRKDAYNRACDAYYYLKDLTNPFDINDNRHKWFKYYIQFIHDFEDTLDVMGRGDSKLKSKKVVVKPIIEYSQLHLHNFD